MDVNVLLTETILSFICPAMPQYLQYFLDLGKDARIVFSNIVVASKSIGRTMEVGEKFLGISNIRLGRKESPPVLWPPWFVWFRFVLGCSSFT